MSLSPREALAAISRLANPAPSEQPRGVPMMQTPGSIVKIRLILDDVCPLDPPPLAAPAPYTPERWEANTPAEAFMLLMQPSAPGSALDARWVSAVVQRAMTLLGRKIEAPDGVHYRVYRREADQLARVIRLFRTYASEPGRTVNPVLLDHAIAFLQVFDGMAPKVAPPPAPTYDDFLDDPEEFKRMADEFADWCIEVAK